MGKLRRQFGVYFGSLSRPAKRLVMMVADFTILAVALWAAYALRLAELWPQPYLSRAVPLFLLVPAMGVLLFYWMGLYRVVIRFSTSGALLVLTLKGVVVLACLVWSLAYVLAIPQFPRSVPVNFSILVLLLVVSSRLCVRGYYQWLVRYFADKEPVLIYGAGNAGVHLANSLAGGKDFYVAGFLDDDATLWGSSMLGVQVHDPKQASQLVKEHNIKRILLALPSVSSRRRKLALDKLEGLSVHVQTVPSLPEIVSGKATLEQFREVEVEDLLGRDPVPPRQELLDISVRGKTVLVTGAGGSIGSELCRQLLKLEPKRLILLEVSEFALYSIHQELRQINQEQQLNVRLRPFLGSVCNRDRVEAILSHYGVETVYHAAAYKHVPMLEHNIFEGVRNNVMGTLVLAESAAKYKVERFILISTDKAVRPTNVMGATKRLSELILQALADDDQQQTVFSMVRFGNVLGSSGSVVPLFREQIANGGPVTVTHPDITRYFMTIPEAALLVIQAGSMAEGGDVFVLEMGEPVRIVDLAHRMVELSGLEVKSDENPHGDVEITFSGLRPGEKLFEELLIGDEVTGTEHPKIMRAQEEVMPGTSLNAHLQALIEAENCQDMTQARRVLKDAVNGFVPNSPLVDWLMPKTLRS